MSKPQYARETAQVQQAHPDLDPASAQRVAEQLVDVARETNTPLATLVAETLRAENGSAAGNQTSP